MARTPRRLPASLAAALVLSALGGCTPAGEPQVRDPQAGPTFEPLAQRVPYQHSYVFADDEFAQHTPSWGALLEARRGRPGLQYLEIGVRDGRAFFWMIDNVLTDPTSRATGVGATAGEPFAENLERSGAAERARLVEGPVLEALRSLPADTYDIVHIDGPSSAEAVLEATVLAWPLLRVDGLMILDDYGRNGGSDASHRPVSADLLARTAIDAFLSAYRNSVQVVFKQSQMALRKLPPACPRSVSHCSRLGAYGYDWSQRALYRGVARIELTDEEREIVEVLIESRTGDGLTIELDPRVRRSHALAEIDEKLGLDLE